MIASHSTAMSNLLHHRVDVLLHLMVLLLTAPRNEPEQSAHECTSSQTHEHTHTHSCTHTNTHTNTHSNTRSCTPMHTHAHSCTLMHIHTYAHTHAHIHSCSPHKTRQQDGRVRKGRGTALTRMRHLAPSSATWSTAARQWHHHHRHRHPGQHPRCCNQSLQ